MAIVREIGRIAADVPHLKGAAHLRILILFLFPILSTKGIAAEESKDSISKAFPYIEVSAERIISSPALKYSALTTIDREKIERTGAWQVHETIEKTPGVYIKNYGGLGGIKTISMRGTSAQQTLVMLDGMKLNSTQSGLVDLSTLPVSLIENIEVVRGGNSALYGGNAIGGIVNVRSKDPGSGYKLTGNLDYGSFNEKYIGLSGVKSFDKSHISAFVDVVESDGDYPFTTRQYGETQELTRQNADFLNANVSVAGNYKPGDWNINGRVLARMTDRGTPGAVVQGYIESAEARLEDQEGIFIASAKNQLSSKSSFFLGMMGKLRAMRFRDPNSFGLDGYEGLDNRYTNREMQFTGRYRRKISLFNIEAGLEGNFADLKGGMLQPELSDYVKRSAGAVYGRTEAEFDPLSLQAGLRYDMISDAGNALSPMAGVYYSPEALPANFKLNWSYNFRPPSFNEMYYLNYGTADLKPERSQSLNAGVNVTPFDFLTVDLSGFLISTEDGIVSVPKSPVTWSAENLGEIYSRGIEVNGRAELNLWKLKIAADLSYTLQKVTDESDGSITKGKLVVYQPQEILAGNLILDTGIFTIGGNFNYSGFRYYLPDNSYGSLLPEYAIVNLHAEKDFDTDLFAFTLRFDIKNLFDERYSVIRNYPMPGRLYRAGVSVEIGGSSDE